MRQTRMGFIFDSESSQRFKYGKYKILRFRNTEDDKRYRSKLHVGGVYRGRLDPIISGHFNVLDEDFLNLDGYCFNVEVEEVQPPDDFQQYFKTIDPSLLREDYKIAYYQILGKNEPVFHLSKKKYTLQKKLPGTGDKWETVTHFHDGDTSRFGKPFDQEIAILEAKSYKAHFKTQHVRIIIEI